MVMGQVKATPKFPTSIDALHRTSFCACWWRKHHAYHARLMKLRQDRVSSHSESPMRHFSGVLTICWCPLFRVLLALFASRLKKLSRISDGVAIDARVRDMRHRQALCWSHAA